MSIAHSWQFFQWCDLFYFVLFWFSLVLACFFLICSVYTIWLGSLEQTKKATNRSYLRICTSDSDMITDCWRCSDSTTKKKDRTGRAKPGRGRRGLGRFFAEANSLLRFYFWSTSCDKVWKICAKTSWKQDGRNEVVVPVRFGEFTNKGCGQVAAKKDKEWGSKEIWVRQFESAVSKRLALRSVCASLSLTST